jgi:hypothetical protein
MPVTSRRLLVRNISIAGKKGPNTLRYDPVKKQIINTSCNCIPGPVNIQYTVAGSYTDILPALPSGYSWLINGTLITGGGGGGGGGSALIIIPPTVVPGSGGQTFNTIFSIPITGIFPGGSTISSIVGAGGLGGAGGSSSSGSNGLAGNKSSITVNSIYYESPPSIGGLGGIIGGGSISGQPGGTGSGSSGSGGNGGTDNSGFPGLPGTAGSVTIVATAIRF